MNSTQLSLSEEMLLLQEAYFRVFRECSYSEPIRDNTFRPENWLVNFPFNCWHNNSSQSLEMYRTLALVNALYFTFILREDTVIDDYHLPRDEFQPHILEYCQARVMREVAMKNLLDLCGSEVAAYILRYEQMYYNALIWEKTLRSEDVSLAAMASREHCEQLGRKVMPLCLTFAAFCLLTDSQEHLPHCEELIIQYHTAHQLFDDMSDVFSDLEKPDCSYLLRALEHQGIEKTSLTADNAKQILLDTGVAAQFVNVAERCLRVAREKAERLRFVYMLEQIERLERKVEAGRALLHSESVPVLAVSPP
jgi:hypothetical protein